MSKVTPFLMFDGRLEQAIELYRRVLPGFELKKIAHTGPGGPAQMAEFVLGGQEFKAFNGGPSFKFTEGFSLFVDCEDQAEVDEYWEKLLAAGSKPTACGWINDPFGLSWQIIPRRLMEMIADPDPKRAKAAVDAMLKMQKIEVAELEAAYASAGDATQGARDPKAADARS